VLFRQRPPGSYDALRLRRLGFGRRVFLRHALPEFKVWGSVNGLLNSYRDVMWQYYDYFSSAAAERAEIGAPRADIQRVVWGAFRTFPLRATFHVIAPKPLRRAFWSTLLPSRRSTPTVTAA